MVYQRRSIKFNHETRDDYRWLDCCCFLDFTALSFEGGASESDEESDEANDEDDGDDDDEENDEDEDDGVVESERFLFLDTIRRLYNRDCSESFR